MEKERELDIKLQKISSKLGSVLVKELLNKQYKLNYYQRFRAQSQAFHSWKLLHREGVAKDEQVIAKSNNKSKSNTKSSLKIKNHKKELNDSDHNKTVKMSKKLKRDKMKSMLVNKHKVWFIEAVGNR